MNAKYVAIMVAGLILIMVIEAIRRQKMTFKYSLSWLVGSAAVLILALNSELLAGLAHKLGFKLTSNFVFFLILSFFVYLSLFLTVYINEQNSRTETLAQRMAILEFRLEEQNRNKKQDTKKDLDH